MGSIVHFNLTYTLLFWFCCYL